MYNSKFMIIVGLISLIIYVYWYINLFCINRKILPNVERQKANNYLTISIVTPIVLVVIGLLTLTISQDLTHEAFLKESIVYVMSDNFPFIGIFFLCFPILIVPSLWTKYSDNKLIFYYMVFGLLFISTHYISFQIFKSYYGIYLFQVDSLLKIFLITNSFLAIVSIISFFFSITLTGFISKRLINKEILYKQNSRKVVNIFVINALVITIVGIVGLIVCSIVAINVKDFPSVTRVFSILLGFSSLSAIILAFYYSKNVISVMSLIILLFFIKSVVHIYLINIYEAVTVSDQVINFSMNSLFTMLIFMTIIYNILRNDILKIVIMTVFVSLYMLSYVVMLLLGKGYGYVFVSLFYISYIVLFLAILRLNKKRMQENK